MHAQSPSAVVAGNTETCQRVADTVLLALGQATELPAQGQGTMNNLVIGGGRVDVLRDDRRRAGGEPRRAGPSGVHVGMSNALNTPIEAFELEYPMRVERYELEYGSAARASTAAGTARCAPSACSSRPRCRSSPTAAATGRSGPRVGGTGARGENRSAEELPAKVTRELVPGDVVTVRTPAGGGWG